jgi:hypothetical protein
MHRAFSTFTLLCISALFPFFASGISIRSVSEITDTISSVKFPAGDHVYQKYIQAVEVSRVGFAMADPIITLNTEDRFHVCFDDLQGGMKQYYYTLIHCNADWTKSEIWVNEYIEGYEEGQVEEFQSSFNTRTAYTHYECQFPNDQLRFKISGNYILRVFSRDQKGNEINAFTRRLMVVDPKVELAATIGRAGTTEDYETRQEVDFKISTTGYRIDSPYQDIKVVVLQNLRWDNALTGLKPYMVRGDVLDYSYDNGTNQFDGINEFRRFDLKSLKFLSEKVREITFDDTMYFVKLWESEKRSYKQYIFENDLNGKFLLKADDVTSVSDNGEYCMVKFFLPFEELTAEGNLYVAGGFNAWQYTPENKMQYNYSRKGYEASILFKQGYFNYVYVFVPNNSKTGDATRVEGNHSITRNSYTILVYHRAKGELYDELIAARTFESGL